MGKVEKLVNGHGKSLMKVGGIAGGFISLAWIIQTGLQALASQMTKDVSEAIREIPTLRAHDEAQRDQWAEQYRFNAEMRDFYQSLAPKLDRAILLLEQKVGK